MGIPTYCIFVCLSFFNSRFYLNVHLYFFLYKFYIVSILYVLLLFDACILRLDGLCRAQLSGSCFVFCFFPRAMVNRPRPSQAPWVIRERQRPFFLFVFLLFSVSHLWPKNAKGWRYNHIAPYYLDVPCPFENSKFNWTIGRVVLMHSHQWIFILQILPRLLRTVFWKTIRLVDFMALCGTKAPANVFSLHVQPDVCVSSLVPSALKGRVRFAGVSLPRSSWVSSPREKPHSRTVGFHSFLRSFSTSKAWLHGTVLLVDNKNPRLDRAHFTW